MPRLLLSSHFLRVRSKRAQLDTTKVGRRCRAAQSSTRTSGAMFWHAYPQGSASIAALAGGEIGANRQVCPTIGGGCVKMHPVQSRVRRKFAFSGFEPLAHGDKTDGTRAGDEGDERDRKSTRLN